MTPLRQFASQIQSSFPTKHNGQTTQIDSLKTQTTVIDFLERKEPSLPQTHTQNCNTLQSSCQQSQSQSHNSLSKSTVSAFVLAIVMFDDIYSVFFIE
jgi:hypothetical protein